MRLHNAVTIAGSLILLIAQAQAGSQPSSEAYTFDEAWAAYRSQDSSLMSNYVASNASKARSVAMAILKNCIAGREDVKQILDQEFRMVARIRSDGTVDQVFVRGLPEEETTCLEEVTKNQTFTEPPVVPFYLGTAMKITPR